METINNMVLVCEAGLKVMKNFLPAIIACVIWSTMDNMPFRRGGYAVIFTFAIIWGMFIS